LPQLLWKATILLERDAAERYQGRKFSLVDQKSFLDSIDPKRTFARAEAQPLRS
jgi:hypothetical protein